MKIVKRQGEQLQFLSHPMNFTLILMSGFCWLKILQCFGVGSKSGRLGRGCSRKVDCCCPWYWGNIGPVTFKVIGIRCGEDLEYIGYFCNLLCNLILNHYYINCDKLMREGEVL
jgi:hypothetical protein